MCQYCNRVITKIKPNQAGYWINNIKLLPTYGGIQYEKISLSSRKRYRKTIPISSLHDAKQNCR